MFLYTFQCIIDFSLKTRRNSKKEILDQQTCVIVEGIIRVDLERKNIDVWKGSCWYCFSNIID